ncbi:TetR/AcrR family transcriptional regulator [Actinoalloteichus caeruleus]|uniref:TetR/AcrR family transcriptional regulator n=1 Tax=Actinoalloteichus cyanogriseus TaxID=2893586 RepID=UPI0004C19A34|nr:TetR/AcrR family transcriptional regulator [Actinoalloteichus caeruleus]
MGRTEGRTAEDTKRLILRAAAQVIRRDGLAASLDDIAAEAGVSKGGLVYHFRSKQALLVALGESIARGFEALVTSRIDPSDTRPGRLTRAYIRACFADVEDPVAMRDNIAIAAHLISDDDLQELADRDGRRWRARLREDGLPDRTITLVIAACDGVSTGPLWGSALDGDDVRELERDLIGLTESGPGPGSGG